MNYVVSSALPNASNRRLYNALISRDRRFDGRFFAGVVTTGIYCRPICPARKPKFENCRFFRSAAEAQEQGFRPCKRCRPEAAPASPAWMGTATTVKRAVKLITTGGIDAQNIDALADTLGVSSRHLRRLFSEHVGVSPKRFAQTVRLDLANGLLHNSDISITEVAIASGFGSLRRFNNVYKEIYKTNPSQIRRSNLNEIKGCIAPPIRLELSFREPYDWRSILTFLRRRAIQGLEVVEDSYFARSISVDRASGVFTASLNKNKPSLVVEIWLSKKTPLFSTVDAIENIFDVGADVDQITSDLKHDSRLKPIIADSSGSRVPGGWSVFEQGVRSIVDQQASLEGARTILARVVERLGAKNELPKACELGCKYLFPSPEAICKSDLYEAGITRSMANTLRQFAEIFSQEPKVQLDEQALMAKVKCIPGIDQKMLSEWKMRGFKDPDAFCGEDHRLLTVTDQLGIAKTPNELMHAAEAWRPWRAYAAELLRRILDERAPNEDVERSCRESDFARR